MCTRYLKILRSSHNVVSLSVLFLVLAARPAVAERATYPVRWNAGFNFYFQVNFYPLGDPEAEKPMRNLEQIRASLQKDFTPDSQLELRSSKRPDQIAKKDSLAEPRPTIKNCADFLKIDLQEFELVHPSDIGALFGVGEICTAAKWLLEGKAATRSYIETIPRDARIVKYMPDSVAQHQGGPHDIQRKGRNWPEAEGGLKYVESRYGQMRFESKLSDHFVIIIGSGDFNDDGIEDLIISISHAYKEGRGAEPTLYVFTRYKNEGKLVIIKQYSVYE